MTTPSLIGLGASALAGNLGLYTASFFRLDPTGTVPIEPLADVLPGVTPFRITLDAITNEELARTWNVTQHSIQDLFNVTPHRQRNLKQVTVQGVLSAAPLPSLSGGPPPATFGMRFDQLRLSFLERIAEQGEPIMFTSPQHSLPLCWITSLRTPWNASNGRSTLVAITLQEVRIASPELVEGVKDADALESGNTKASSGGEQAGEPFGGGEGNLSEGQGTGTQSGTQGGVQGSVNQASPALGSLKI